MKQKLTALVLSLLLVLGLSACASDEVTDAIIDAGLEIAADALLGEEDIGVIGGADGPTAILVTDGDKSGDISVEENAAEAAPEESAGEDPPAEGKPEDATASSEEPEDLYDLGIEEDGTYNSAEEVALYLHTYGRLPDNYVTKSEARELGWEGGSVERWAGEGTAIGGSKFGNNEGLLPKGKGRQYYECDIDTVGRSSRGAKRLVYSNDGLIYYTEDHYESFELLYGEESK